MAIIIEHVGAYPKKSFKATATKLWDEFFKTASDRVDVAYWYSNALGEYVALSARSSSVHELSFGFEEIDPVYVRVPQVGKVLDAVPESEYDAVCQSFREWMEKGILDAFQSARITKNYQRFNPDGNAFAIVTCDTEGKFPKAKMSLLWTGQPRLSAARIRGRYKAAEAAAIKERRSRKLVKKKPAKRIKKKRAKIIKAKRARGTNERSTIITIEHAGGYPNKSFKATATKVWNEFFKTATDRVDVAYWHFEAFTGHVQVAARSSSVHELSIGFEEIDPVFVRVPGVFELFNAEPDWEHDAMCQSFREWMEEGILDAFQSARITKKYQRFNPDGNAFAMVTCDNHDGFTCEEMSLLWTSRPRFSVARIKSRYKAADAAARKERIGWKLVKKKPAKGTKKEVTKAIKNKRAKVIKKKR